MGYLLTVTLNSAVDTTLTVPAVELGHSYTASHTLKLPGGKGLNVARVLHTLGAPVHATGLLGGPPATLVRKGLDDAGIAATFLDITGVTRTCTAVVEGERHRVTEINEPGPTVAPDEARAFLDLFERLLKGAEVAILSGSLPPGLDDAFYALLIDRAHAAGVPAVLDTSGRSLAPGVGARPLLIKPNAIEAAALLGAAHIDPDEAAAAARRLSASGPAAVAITLGAHGAVLATTRGCWWAGLDVMEPPVSTVGCGDAFLAGLVASLHASARASGRASMEDVIQSEGALRAALVEATACAAANTRCIGAGLLDVADVEHLRHKVVVRAIA